jgi:hypothetical protein
VELKEREQEQLNRFAERMRIAIAEEALEAARGNNSSSAQSLTNRPDAVGAAARR